MQIVSNNIAETFRHLYDNIFSHTIRVAGEWFDADIPPVLSVVGASVVGLACSGLVVARSTGTDRITRKGGEYREKLAIWSEQWPL